MEILTGQKGTIPLGWRRVGGVVMDQEGQVRSACFFCDTFHPGVRGHFYGATGCDVKVWACERCAEVVDMDPVRVVRAAMRGRLPRASSRKDEVVPVGPPRGWLL